MIADTVLFGGCRLRPIQVNGTDPYDPENDPISVILRISGEDKGYGTWNPETGYYEWNWTGLVIGPYVLEFRAMDEFGYYSDWVELVVWNFCFIP